MSQNPLFKDEPMFDVKTVITFGELKDTKTKVMKIVSEHNIQAMYVMDEKIRYLLAHICMATVNCTLLWDNKSDFTKEQLDKITNEAYEAILKVFGEKK